MSQPILATELFMPIITPRTSVGTSAKAAINDGRDRALNRENPIPRKAVIMRPGVQRNHVSAKVPEEPVGWLETELPKPVMSRLQSYIETAKKNPTSLNNDLAGNISKSLTLKDKDDWFFKTILIALIDKFLEKFCWT